jgi:hypothetical protein
MFGSECVYVHPHDRVPADFAVLLHEFTNNLRRNIRSKYPKYGTKQGWLRPKISM